MHACVPTQNRIHESAHAHGPKELHVHVHLLLLLVSRRPILGQVAVLLLAEGERHVLVLHHVLDPALHRQHDQEDEVRQQHRPDDREVEGFEEGHGERHDDRAGGRQPTVELRELAREGPELLAVARRRQHRAVALGVHGGGQEPYDAVQKVDSQAIRDEDEALQQVHPHQEHAGRERKDGPPRLDPDGCLVNIVLHEVLQVRQFAQDWWLLLHLAALVPTQARARVVL
mmetsp:Transcript_60340/g.186810  ORF Transcript_60340/g.186810 Transcript_60340/m.186810 type:complete len:229 (-) Transcript_60340:44-730(-)